MCMMQRREQHHETHEPSDALCRECGGWREVLMFWLGLAIARDDPNFESVELHPCPYCTRNDA
jgi:hypothetical protein